MRVPTEHLFGCPTGIINVTCPKLSSSHTSPLFFLVFPISVKATLSFQLLRSKILEFLTPLIPHPISKLILSMQPSKCIQNMIIPHHFHGYNSLAWISIKISQPPCFHPCPFSLLSTTTRVTQLNHRSDHTSLLLNYPLGSHYTHNKRQNP